MSGDAMGVVGGLGANCFTSTARVCAWCDLVRQKGSYSTCSKCKVTAYCSSDCQANHWKDAHKATCKSPDSISPPCIPTTITEGLDDLAHPYKFVLVAPLGEGQRSKAAWQASVSGIDDPVVVSCLEGIFTAAVDKDAKGIEAADAAATNFGWKTPTCRIVPGYSARFNGFSLKAMHDTNYQSHTELGNNLNAAYLCHESPDRWFGNVVVGCTYQPEQPSEVKDSATLPSDPHPSGDPAIKRELMTSITRQQVLDAIEYHQQCSAEFRTVPDRIRYENMCRAAGLRKFKKEQFHMLGAGEL